MKKKRKQKEDKGKKDEKKGKERKRRKRTSIMPRLFTPVEVFYILHYYKLEFRLTWIFVIWSTQNAQCFQGAKYILMWTIIRITKQTSLECVNIHATTESTLCKTTFFCNYSWKSFCVESLPALHLQTKILAQSHLDRNCLWTSVFKSGPGFSIGFSLAWNRNLEDHSSSHYNNVIKIGIIIGFFLRAHRMKRRNTLKHANCFVFNANIFKIIELTIPASSSNISK